jgi:hypothetical protein
VIRIWITTRIFWMGSTNRAVLSGRDGPETNTAFEDRSDPAQQRVAEAGSRLTKSESHEFTRQTTLSKNSCGNETRGTRNHVEFLVLLHIAWHVLNHVEEAGMDELVSGKADDTRDSLAISCSAITNEFTRSKGHDT